MVMKKLVVILLMIVLPTSVYAAEGGLSNYVPAFYGDFALAVAPPDGLSFKNDVFYFSGDIGGSLRSGLVEANADVTLVYDYISFLYKPGFKVFGAPVAFSITPAIGHADIEADIRVGALSAEFNDDHAGLGDTTLAAMLYWNHEKFHFSWSNYIVTPTGDYDVDDLANTGMNYWTFEVDVAATYLNEEKGQDYSVVVGYGYNTENDDTDYQSGDEIHLDVVLNQFLTESFAIGMIGYFYKQIGGDSGDGALLGSFKGEGAGIGPAIYHSKRISGKDVYFIAKWVHDYHAEKRIKGDYAYGSFALSF
jgi:hypothetical protein